MGGTAVPYPPPVSSPIRAYKGRFFTESHVFAPPSPWQGEGWGEGASPRCLFPPHPDPLPQRGRGRPKRLPLSCHTKKPTAESPTRGEEIRKGILHRLVLNLAPMPTRGEGLAAQILRDVIPVHDVPESPHIVGSGIAVIDIIGVLPDIERQ